MDCRKAGPPYLRCPLYKSVVYSSVPIYRGPAVGSHQPLACFREAIKLLLLRRCRLRFLGWQDIVCQAIARQIQRIDRLNDTIGVEESIRIAGLLIVDGEFDGAGYTLRKVGTLAIGEKQVLAPRLCVGLGVVLLDEAARAPHQVETHQIAPIVWVITLLESGQR